MHHLDALRERGGMYWRAQDHAWIADPDEVVEALGHDGYAEYRREIATEGREAPKSGGMWQGLNASTAGVATVIWVTHGLPSDSHVFIKIDGRPVEGDAWSEIDHAVLDALAGGGGRLTPAEIAKRVGMSEAAVQSVIMMLAQEGRIRIAAVELL